MMNIIMKYSSKLSNFLNRTSAIQQTYVHMKQVGKKQTQNDWARET